MALAAWTWYNKALQHPNTPDRCGPMYAEVTPGWHVFKQIFTEHWEGFKRNTAKVALSPCFSGIEQSHGLYSNA